jgi:hypothetical protein
MATLAQVDRDTVSPWITPWAQEGAARCQDQPRRGRPPQLTPAEPALALASSQAEPRALAARKRLAHKARRRGTRVSQSCQSRREPAALATGPRARAALPQPADHDQSALSYGEAAGLARAPAMPDAWQAPERVSERPARHYGRSHGCGCRPRHHD